MDYLDEDQDNKKTTLEEYLKNKYGQMGLDDDKRTNLEAKVSEAEPAGWRKGLAAAGAALAGNDAGSAVRSLYGDQEQARQNLKDFDNRREKVIGDIGNEQKFQNMQHDEAMKQRESDPNSQESLMAQSMAKQMMPKGDFSNSTATDLKASLPMLEKMYNVEQNRLSRQDTLNANQGAKAEKQNEKQKQDQDKAYSDMRKDLETFRGNRPVQQAALDTYSAQKALALVKDKDPNTLTTQDLALLNNEIAKIATGGIPGEHGVQALMPNTLKTKAAEMQSFIMSKPSDAEAGEFVKKNLNYLQGMVNESNKNVRAYRSNLMKGYKNRVRKEDMDEAMSDYQMNVPDEQTDKKKVMHADDLPEID